MRICIVLTDCAAVPTCTLLQHLWLLCIPARVASIFCIFEFFLVKQRSYISIYARILQ
jgi:hypothetical protein